MIRFIRSLAPILVVAFCAQAQTTGGKFYAVWWDGSSENFGSIDPYTGQHNSLAVIPGVKFVDLNYHIFNTDSSRFVFVGGPSGSVMNYVVVDAATGTVTGSTPRNDNLKNPAYESGTGRTYGTWWSDSTVTEYDSLGRPKPTSPGQLRGTEYFAAIEANGQRRDTPIPGLKLIGTGSQFFDSENGRYVLWGQDTAGVASYYIIDVATGVLAARIPLGTSLYFPAYNPLLGAVHGLWWSDSTVREYDSLGRPKPTTASQLRGAEYFVTVRLKDSSVSMVKLPVVKYLTNFNRALDVDSQRYVFTGMEATGSGRYFVVDVATGALLSNAIAAGNINHLVYAPMKSTVFPLGNTVAVRPARTGSVSTRSLAGAREIAFENPSGAPHALRVIDAAGRIVLTIEGIRSNVARVETAGLKPGVHAFRVTGPKGVVATGKFVVD